MSANYHTAPKKMITSKVVQIHPKIIILILSTRKSLIKSLIHRVCLVLTFRSTPEVVRTVILKNIPGRGKKQNTHKTEKNFIFILFCRKTFFDNFFACERSSRSQTIGLESLLDE